MARLCFLIILVIEFGREVKNMKERNIICQHYERAGVCAISKKKCFVSKEMQHCAKYVAVKGGKPIKPDNRKAKLERAKKRAEEH